VAVELDQLDSKLISSDHQPDGIGEVRNISEAWQTVQ
jgi:hypothetical protein